MTQKLSELLAQRTAQRRQEEHNAREAARLGAHQEFADDGDTRPLVGDEMAEKLLPKLSKWDKQRLAIAKDLAKHDAKGQAATLCHADRADTREAEFGVLKAI